MTPKQAAFVDEYVVDFNATQAAIRAGYSERSAYNIGYCNLKHPEIMVALEARLAALAIDPASVGVASSEAATGAGEAEEADLEAVEAPRKKARPRPAAAPPEVSQQLSQLTLGWVLAQLVEIAERCMREVPVRDRAGRETGEWTFKPREALAALTLLGKHLGMFSARLDVRFLREQAEAVASEYDLDVDEVIAEAQKWLQGRGRGS